MSYWTEQFESKMAGLKLIQGRLYLCNPDKNTECKKTTCYRNGGDCMLTKEEQFKW